MPIKGECVYNDEVPNTLHDNPIPENITPEIDPEDEGPEEVPLDEPEEVPEDEPEEVPNDHQFVGYSEQQMIEAYWTGSFPDRCFSPDFIRRMEEENRVVEVILTPKPKNNTFLDGTDDEETEDEF